MLTCEHPGTLCSLFLIIAQYTVLQYAIYDIYDIYCSINIWPTSLNCCIPLKTHSMVRWRNNAKNQFRVNFQYHTFTLDTETETVSIEALESTWQEASHNNHTMRHEWRVIVSVKWPTRLAISAVSRVTGDNGIKVKTFRTVCTLRVDVFHFLEDLILSLFWPFGFDWKNFFNSGACSNGTFKCQVLSVKF